MSEWTMLRQASADVGAFVAILTTLFKLPERGNLLWSLHVQTMRSLKEIENKFVFRKSMKLHTWITRYVPPRPKDAISAHKSTIL